MANASILAAFESMWQHVVNYVDSASTSSKSGIANLHVWKKYTGDPSILNESTVSNLTLGTRATGNFPDIVYYTSYTYENGVITVSGRNTLRAPSLTNCSVLGGKYVKVTTQDGVITSLYYIPTNATFSVETGTLGISSFVASTATKLYIGSFVEYAASDSASAYPNGTMHTDNYWYEYKGQIGDSVGATSDTMIENAIGGSY